MENPDPRRTGPHGGFWAAAAFVGVTGLASVPWLDAAAAAGIPVRGRIPDFELIDQDGRPIKDSDLRGKVWIADFIFTRCRTICPVMTDRMRGLQGELPSGVRLVSFSVDPDHDRPEVLKEYAGRHSADPGRWTFVTGELEPIYDLAGDGFLVDTKQTRVPGRWDIIHSDLFCLVDRRLRLRGQYAVDDPTKMSGLVRDAGVLQTGLVGRLPHLNVALNAATALLLAAGWILVRRRRWGAHRACMLSALVVSLWFLTSYVIYHFFHGATPFRGEGPVRTGYFALLLSHTLLAVGMVPFVIATAWRAIRVRFEAHARVARWTLPVWLYVSVTGVLVYFLLYHVYA